MERMWSGMAKTASQATQHAWTMTSYLANTRFESLFYRHEAAIVVPPRSKAVPSRTPETAPRQRDRNVRSIAEHGRAAWQNASRYTKRAQA